MVPSFSLAVLLASSLSLLARAEVGPNTPPTGKPGDKCTITWTGDSNSTSNWSNMAIEFMTGDNFEMVFLTTVATGLDGTKDGSFSWTCPDVSPYSSIYFYQFISPAEVSNQQWTTRFAISSPSGETTPPPNATQSDGSAIPWGIGALVNAASVSAAPSFAANATTGGSAAPTSTGAANSTSTTATSHSVVSITTGLSNTAGLHASSSSSGSATAAPASSTNSGLELAVDARVWTTAFGVVGSAMALALFL